VLSPAVPPAAVLVVALLVGLSVPCGAVSTFTGEAFDFMGEPGRFYSLINTPGVQVRARTAGFLQTSRRQLGREMPHCGRIAAVLKRTCVRRSLPSTRPASVTIQVRCPPALRAVHDMLTC